MLPSEAMTQGCKAALAAVTVCALTAAFPAAASAASATGPPLRAAAAPRSELEPVRTIAASTGARIVRYEQRVGGVPVRDAEAIVLDLPGEPPRLTLDDSRAAIEPPLRPTLSAQQAIAAARAAEGVDRLRADPATRLVIEPGEGGAVAWEVVLAGTRPLADLLVVVDARSGAVLAREDLLKRYRGRARLYDMNAVMRNDGYTGMRDRGDRNSRRLTRLRRGVELRRLQSARGCLRGRWVEARVGRVKRRVCRRSFDFRNVKREQNAFEALMAYFHVDRAQAYIQSLDLSAPANDRRQRVGANAISIDNSFFTPATRGIKLGTGGVDDGEDGDVIVHEYGHAVQDAQVRFFGGNFDGAAIGEGFGDYLAAAVSVERAPQPADPFRDWNACMFEWDAVSYTNDSCLRRTNLGLTRDDAMADPRRGDVHYAGQAWSSALWELRGEIGDDAGGRSVVDRAVLESHFLLSRTPSFSEAAIAVLDADAALYGGTHCLAIRSEMVQRDFLDNPSRYAC